MIIDTPRELASDVRHALQRFRGALIELYSQVGADPGVPQDVSRRFGIHKNLAWKLARVMSASDPFASIQHLPGDAGIDIALDAFQKSGADVSVVDNVRAALANLDDTIAIHAGDRAHLELILDSMGLLGSPTQLVNSRELAFQGNSGIWGVQARTRLTTGVVVPSKTHADKLDIALVGGFLGFRRLRPDVRWSLFRFKGYHDDGSPRNTGFEPIDASDPADVPRLMRRFCSSSMPRIEVVQADGDTEYILPGGPVGNLGAFDCYFGEIVRAAPMYRTPNDRFGEFATGIRLPIETLVFDLIVHQDVPMPHAPKLLVQGEANTSPDLPGRAKYNLSLPITDPILDLAGSPPVVTTPLVPKYSDVMSTVYSRLGRAPSEFRGYRMIMKYPPMSSQVLLRWELPEHP